MIRIIQCLRPKKIELSKKCIEGVKACDVSLVAKFIPVYWGALRMSEIFPSICASLHFVAALAAVYLPLVLEN